MRSRCTATAADSLWIEAIEKGHNCWDTNCDGATVRSILGIMFEAKKPPNKPKKSSNIGPAQKE